MRYTVYWSFICSNNPIFLLRSSPTSLNRPPKSNRTPTKQGKNVQNPQNFSLKSHLLSYRSDDDKVLRLSGVCGPILPTCLSILSIRLKNEATFSADSGLDTPHIDTNIDSLGFSWLVSSMMRHLIVFQCSDCLSMSVGSGNRDVGENHERSVIGLHENSNSHRFTTNGIKPAKLVINEPSPIISRRGGPTDAVFGPTFT